VNRGLVCFDLMGAGFVKEYDSPAKLMEQQPESLFAALVHEYQARSNSAIDLRSLEG
jgi:hypothetical protein